MMRSRMQAIASWLSALLALSAAGFLIAALTARSLLTSTLLVATLIVLTIACHYLFPPMFEV